MLESYRRYARPLRLALFGAALTLGAMRWLAEPVEPELVAYVNTDYFAAAHEAAGVAHARRDLKDGKFKLYVGMAGNAFRAASRDELRRERARDRLLRAKGIEPIPMYASCFPGDGGAFERGYNRVATTALQEKFGVDFQEQGVAVLRNPKPG